jgi:hypothetical protein
MDVMWVYLAVLIASALGAMFLYRLVNNASARERIGGWAMLAVGICFLAFYFFDFEPSSFGLVAGVACVAGGIVALRTARWNEHLRRLQ